MLSKQGMEVAQNLTTIARELNSKVAGDRSHNDCRLPPLLFMTDETRMPNLAAVIETLPSEVGIIFRHYGDVARSETCAKARGLAKERGLLFLVAKDIQLAEAVAADGLHLPEFLQGKAPSIRHRHPNWLITSAVHGEEAIDKASADIDALILSPIFKTQSHQAAKALGVQQASTLAQASFHPVYALGGIAEETAAALIGTPFIGIAGIDCFMPN